MAIPVITEIDETLTWTLKISKKINDKTKAIIVVHMLGVPANLKEIKKIATKHQIPDRRHCLGVKVVTT